MSCIVMSCKLVCHFHVLHFHCCNLVLKFHVLYFHRAGILMVRNFQVLHFQLTQNQFLYRTWPKKEKQKETEKEKICLTAHTVFGMLTI